jgi:site-specific DNA-methyltransferase (adenine-specific)
MTHSLHLGDCRAVLATLGDNSIDSIVCDPPYELGFMGKAWDNSGIAYDVTVWQQCLRVLKPGGHLVAFGGSRTYHRLAVAIEDAGFEIRDQIQWIYSQGFPKSHNLKDEYQGYGTALKPAHEPAVLARKPLCGTVADNVMAWGVGALNIDGTRIATEDDMARPASNGRHMEDRPWVKRRINAGLPSRPETPDNGLGRWPANVILDEDAAKALDAQSGGNVSRFFYTAKASKAEREAGLDAPIGERANIHTTVKPLSLMRYLVRLVTPKGGKVLDPFMGSGSTGCAAVLEGFDFVGIDITPEYVAIAQKRVDHYAVTSPLMEL